VEQPVTATTPGRVRRFSRHPATLCVLFALLIVYGGVYDVIRVVDAARRKGVAVGVPVAFGVGIAVAVMAFCLWYVRRWTALRAGQRQFFGTVLAAVAVASVIAYLWTHHRYGDSALTTSLGVAVVTYGVTVVFAAVPLGFGLLWRMWLADRRTARQTRQRD